jgi:hypothetical protein
MSWERVLAILAGWMVVPALVWVMARELMRFAQKAGIILPAHQSKSGAGDGFVSRLLHLMQFRHIQR